MSRFTSNNLPLAGLKLLKRRRLGDSRGYLERLFCIDELDDSGWSKPVNQINLTFTARCGAVRGMHYQIPPSAEMKLITCIRGEVWDVAIDLRAGSKTFLHWHAEILSAENRSTLLIPEGFAHGFQALSSNVELLYCHTASHNPSAEASINAKDSRLAIEWPLEITELSKKDAMNPLIDSNFAGVLI